MKLLTDYGRAVSLAAITVFVGVAVVASFFTFGNIEAQDVDLKPTYGSTTLKGGSIKLKPLAVQLVAGGKIKTNLGGVDAYVANAPDYKLQYTASENVSLTIRADSKADTTLLINLPDGTWIADDDSGGNQNPKLTFARPQSGRYDIYVGTYGKDFANATLYFEEFQVGSVSPKKTPLTPPRGALVIPAIAELPEPVLPKLRIIQAP